MGGAAQIGDILARPVSGAHVLPTFHRHRQCAVWSSRTLATYSGGPRFVVGIPRSNLARKVLARGRRICSCIRRRAPMGHGRRASEFRSMGSGPTSTVRLLSTNEEQRSRRASTARESARTAIWSKLL